MLAIMSSQRPSGNRLLGAAVRPSDGWAVWLASGRCRALAVPHGRPSALDIQRHSHSRRLSLAAQRPATVGSGVVDLGAPSMSGKNGHHGGNIRVLADPAGFPIWVSGV